MVLLLDYKSMPLLSRFATSYLDFSTGLRKQALLGQGASVLMGSLYSQILASPFMSGAVIVFMNNKLCVYFEAFWHGIRLLECFLGGKGHNLSTIIALSLC